MPNVGLIFAIVTESPRHVDHREAGGTNDMEDLAQRLFEPESILPGQIATRSGESMLHRPEARLMLAVMEDAIATCRRHWGKQPHRRPREFREALAWIESTERGWMYSFENVCETLSLPPERTRTGLLKIVSDSSPEGETLFRVLLRHQAGARHAIGLRRVHTSVRRASRSRHSQPRQNDVAAHG